MTHPSRPRVRLRLIGLGLALIVVALIGAACVPATLPAPSATNAPAPAVAQPPAATAANTPAAATQPGKKGDLPVGVDADGNFYRGDPKAAVKFVEFSDYQ